MMRRRIRALAAALASAMILGAPAVFAGEIVFDDYVGKQQLQTAETPYEEPQYEENASFEEESAEDENNDGDDIYISNNGTTFRIPRSADPAERVFDYAGRFTLEQQNALRAEVEKLEKEKECVVVLLITDKVPHDVNDGSETSQKYMQQFYIDNGFSKDGVGFIIDLENRVLWSIGSGRYRNEDFVDFAKVVYDDCLNVARRGDYYSAAEIFLMDFHAYKNPLVAAIPTPLSLVISAAAALLGLFFLNMRHTSTQPSRATTPKLVPKGYKSLDHREDFLGTTVTRRHIPRVRDSGGGGGGGFSGGFSSGGFSSGGGSFSGGGGKF